MLSKIQIIFKILFERLINRINEVSRGEYDEQGYRSCFIAAHQFNTGI